MLRVRIPVDDPLTFARYLGVRLLAWQEEVLTRTLRPGVKRAYVSVARGNGKSTLGAVVALHRFCAPDARVLIVASDEAQATDIVFENCARMVRRSPLAQLCQIHRREIRAPSLNARLHVLPSDAAGAHGYHPTCVVFDELHTQARRDLWDVLTTSMPGLLLATTTAGYDRTSICWEVYDYARQVLAGSVSDPAFGAYIAEAPEGADWTDETVWAAANPALGTLVSVEYLRTEAARAARSPAAQNAFRRFHLNQWVSQSVRWLDMATWDACGDPVDEQALVGCPATGGLDLSTSVDLTAWVVAVRARDGRVVILPAFWVPSAQLEPSARYHDLYASWAQQGLITVCPGATINYDMVRERVLADCARWRIREVGMDRYAPGYMLAQQLESAGVTIAAISQGMLGMSAPSREFERLVIARQLMHGGHPVLRWMVEGLAVRTDPAGNIRPDKAHSAARIDGVVAAIMAIDRLMRVPASDSVDISSAVVAPRSAAWEGSPWGS